MLVGDSVPLGLAARFDASAAPGLSVGGSFRLGCGITPDPRAIDGLTIPQPADCPPWQKVWPGEVSAPRPAVIALFLGVYEQFDRVVTGAHQRDGRDGAVLGRLRREVPQGRVDGREVLVVGEAAQLADELAVGVCEQRDRGAAAMVADAAASLAVPGSQHAGCADARERDSGDPQRCEVDVDVVERLLLRVARHRCRWRNIAHGCHGRDSDLIGKG